LISACHHIGCELESCWGRCVLDTTLCDQVCQWLVTGWWFSQGTMASSTNKTDCHDINWNIVESGIKHHNPNSLIVDCSNLKIFLPIIYCMIDLFLYQIYHNVFLFFSFVPALS
jgi:hypothetical protein